MDELIALLDGGLSVSAACGRLGLSEGQGLARLVDAGRATVVDGQQALDAVTSWGQVRVIVRSRGAVAEVMSDLGRSRRSGTWWNDEDDRCHLHLDVDEVKGALAIAKGGHLSGRNVRMVAFLDAQGEVLFKVMVPRERADLVPAFNALRGKVAS